MWILLVWLLFFYLLRGSLWMYVCRVLKILSKISLSILLWVMLVIRKIELGRCLIVTNLVVVGICEISYWKIDIKGGSFIEYTVKFPIIVGVRIINLLPTSIFTPKNNQPLIFPSTSPAPDNIFSNLQSIIRSNAHFPSLDRSQIHLAYHLKNAMVQKFVVISDESLS